MAEKDSSKETSSDNDQVIIEDAESKNAGFGSFWRIFAYTDMTGWALNIIAFAAACGSGAMLPLMDLVFGSTITTFNDFGVGKLNPDEFRSQATQWTLWFVYLFIAKFVLTYIWTVSLNISATRTTTRLRIDYLTQILRQDIGFFDRSSSGAIAVQLTANGNLVNIGIAEKLGLAIQGIATFVAAFAVAFAIQWKLTLITLAIVPTIIIVVMICIGIEVKNEAKILDIYGKAGTLAEDAFSSMRTVHAFWAHHQLSDKYATFLENARKEGLKKSPVYGVMFSTEFFCISAGYGLAFWQGIRMYSSGEITSPGDVVVVIFAVIVAATALTQVAPQTLNFTKAASAADGLFKVIDRRSEIDSMSNEGHELDECRGHIKIQDLEFHYPSRPEAQVLNGLNLEIAAGKTTALVGSSGCGKSTVVGLIERWYNPSSGKISLDGVNINDLHIKWLRTNIRLVQQEPVLFNASVFENVSYGLVGTSLVDAPEEERMKLVKDACKRAFADEFIQELPDGYHTQVGERAGRLSGGQKQRIAIARSIVSNPKVLLLDEATSALDPKAERIVQEALENVSHERTTLVIAHKLSTVRKADSIAVMAKGVLVEQGTHDELLRKNGMYAQLVRAQNLEQEKDDEGGDEKRHADNSEAFGTVTNLEKTQTEQSLKTTMEETETTGFDYSLLKCLWLLLKQQKHLWPAMTIVAIASVLGGCTNPGLALVFARTLDVFQLPPSQMISRGDFFSLMFFIIALAIFAIYFSIGWFTVIISQHTTYDFRLQIFKDVLRQDMVFFDRNENTTGALVSKLSTQPQNLHELLGFNICLILIGLSNILASCTLAIAIGWKLGLAVSLGALPVLVFFGYLRVRLEFKLDDAISQRFADSASLASEAVAAIRTVSSLALERTIVSQYQQRVDGIAKKSINSLLWTMIWFSASQSVSFLAMGLGFWYGSRLLSTGEYSSLQFFTVFIAVIFAGEAAAQFFSYTTSITKAQRAANYILWLNAQVPHIRELGSSATSKVDYDGAAHVECEGLEFAYPLAPNIKVLRGIDVEAKPGDTIAFVGASGCGKTTMIALLERYYDPTRGSVSVNGTKISDACPRQYRSGVALVQQEPTLYQFSIRDNVAIGSPSPVTDAQIEDACSVANIFDFIVSLPAGLDTLCGNRGAQLSGGQRQRIAIARAFIRSPKLLLLDEATSALDTESERVVQAALQKVSQDTTTITVAHRLSTIKGADCILVFSRGKVVERGTHRELIAERGVYYEMCLGQGLDQSGHDM